MQKRVYVAPRLTPRFLRAPWEGRGGSTFDAALVARALLQGGACTAQRDGVCEPCVDGPSPLPLRLRLGHVARPVPQKHSIFRCIKESASCADSWRRFQLRSVLSTVPHEPLSGGQRHPYFRRPSHVAGGKWRGDDAMTLFKFGLFYFMVAILVVHMLDQVCACTTTSRACLSRRRGVCEATYPPRDACPIKQSTHKPPLATECYTPGALRLMPARWIGCARAPGRQRDSLSSTGHPGQLLSGVPRA